MDRPQPSLRILHFPFCQQILCIFPAHHGIKKLHAVHQCVYALLPLNGQYFQLVRQNKIKEKHSHFLPLAGAPGLEPKPPNLQNTYSLNIKSFLMMSNDKFT